MLKILHIAPQNYAGVPYDFYKMHLECGDESRLITLHKNPRDFPEDICLNLPLPNFGLVKLWRRKKVLDREEENLVSAPFFTSKNFLENLYFIFNDRLKRKIIEESMEKYHLNDYDIIHYDTGLDFYRDSRQAKKWKREGKKIVCCYFGSDLRTRGIIKEMDHISDLNITSEFDHLSLKKDLYYLFYPYDPGELPQRKNQLNEIIRIIHSPTNRKFKGTDLIISVIERIKKEKKIDFILLENKPRAYVLEEKSKSDICIDQVGGTMGGTGYGKAGIESLAMGIPTITNMTKEYEEWLPENPFVVANNSNELYDKLIQLIDDKKLREEIGEKGKRWVENYHSYKNVNEKLYRLYREKKLI